MTVNQVRRMKEKMGTRVVATLVLIASLSQIGYIILPLRNDSFNIAASGFEDFAEKNQASLRWMKDRGQLNKIEPAEIKEEIKQELWAFWLIQSGITLLGIAVGLIASFRFAYWRATIIVACMLYLVHWAYEHKAIFSAVGLIEAYKVQWDMAVQFDTIFDFFHRDVLLPILYVAIVTVLVMWRSVHWHNLSHGPSDR